MAVVTSFAVVSSTTRPPIPLTTIFTPPATCLDVVTYDGTSLWQGGLRQKGDVGCYPPSFRSIYNSAYTPGICPHSWTSVSGLVGPSVTTSTAFCCPPNFYIFRDDNAAVLRVACSSLITEDLFNVWSTSTRDDGSLPINHPLSTITRMSILSPTVFADVIQVQWQSTNIKILNLLAQATSSSTSSSASLSASPPSTLSIAQPTSTANSELDGPKSKNNRGGDGLSTGAEAGIGIGAALGAVVVAVLIFLFLRNRRRESKEAQSVGREEYKVPGYYETALGEHVQRDPVEMDGRYVGELQGTEMRAELAHKKSLSRGSERNST